MAQPKTLKLLGIDTGGTFTDFVYLDQANLRVHKVLSTPDAPEQAILRGINELGLMDEIRAGHIRVIHGTTVATNATLNRQGVRTAYITNKGLKDILQIGRQTRTELYNLKVQKPTPEMDPGLLFEIDARIDANGDLVDPLTQTDLKALKAAVRKANPEAIAINMLFSFVDDSHEKAIEALFDDYYVDVDVDSIDVDHGRSRKVFVTRSSSILPEYREYERGIATWVNAWLGPLIQSYLQSLRVALNPSPLAIMQSSGLTIAAEQASNKAVNLLLSGPVGGLSAALLIGLETHREKLITFDMGGTSTDVSLTDGSIHLTAENNITGLPIAIPMADIHTIGAGGGSIAYLDSGGLLQVGPESAGAVPGPACYGQGGHLPTVTDANLVLGRLGPGAFLGGDMTLDLNAATRSIDGLAKELGLSVIEVATGIVAIANEHMAQALRAISIEKGFDPREYALVCFGGAGALHVCQLAEALQISSAIIPVHSGVFSALGMLATRPGREVTQTHRVLLGAATNLEEVFVALENAARLELEQEGVNEIQNVRSVDLRYEGQTFTLNIPFGSLNKMATNFEADHGSRYGHNLDRPIELVNLKVHVESTSNPIKLPNWVDGTGARVNESGTLDKANFKTGDLINGPVIITEDHATTYLSKGWIAQLDRCGNLCLEKT